MIRSLAGSKSILVKDYSVVPFIDPSKQSAGLVRYSFINRGLEVYDGFNWQPIGGTAEINLQDDAEHALAWVKRKMLEEAQIDELCKTYPGLENARNIYEAFLQMVRSNKSG